MKITLYIFFVLLTTTLNLFGAEHFSLITGISDYAEYESAIGATENAITVAKKYAAINAKNSNHISMTDLDDGTEMFPSRKNFIDNITRLSLLCNKGDSALLLHFGETQVIDGNLYIIPADATRHDPSSLISLKDLHSIAMNSKGSLSIVVFSKSFTNEHRSAIQKHNFQLPLALLQFDKDNSAQHVIDAMMGGADLFSKGNKNGIVEFGEFINFIAKHNKYVYSNASHKTTKSIELSSLINNDVYNGFHQIRELKAKCDKSIDTYSLKKQLATYEIVYNDLFKKLSQGDFSSSIRQIHTLTQSYSTLLDNSNVYNEASQLLVKCNGYANELIKADVTLHYPNEFTELIVLKKQAFSNYQAANYKKALAEYTKLASGYLKLTYETLITHFAKQVSRETSELYDSVGAESWKKIKTSLSEARNLYRYKEYDKAAVLIQESLKNIDIAKKETSEVIAENIENYSTPKDYKTALIFVDMLSKIKGQAEKAADIRSHLLNNIRFKLGDEQVSKTGITLLYIPAGKFLMGSPRSEAHRDADEYHHNVNLKKGFFLSQTEITNKQWERVMGRRESKPSLKTQGHPATHISWYDAVRFCRKLSAMDGVQYRLPTEAEWEYACRAGTTTAYNTDSQKLTSKDAAIYESSTNLQSTMPAGSFNSNKWGLYDMHGNVWEWCSDWKTPYSSKRKQQQNTSTIRKGEGATKVVRGGSWYDTAEFARSANRYDTLPHSSNSHTGLRIVLIAESIE